jgi:hypothetical protein
MQYEALEQCSPRSSFVSGCYEVNRRFAGGPRGEISNFGPGQSCMGGAGVAVSGSEGLGGAPPKREPQGTQATATAVAKVKQHVFQHLSWILGSVANYSQRLASVTARRS